MTLHDCRFHAAVGKAATAGAHPTGHDRRNIGFAQLNDHICVWERAIHPADQIGERGGAGERKLGHRTRIPQQRLPGRVLDAGGQGERPHHLNLYRSAVRACGFLENLQVLRQPRARPAQYRLSGVTDAPPCDRGLNLERSIHSGKKTRGSPHWIGARSTRGQFHHMRKGAQFTDHDRGRLTGIGSRHRAHARGDGRIRPGEAIHARTGALARTVDTIRPDPST